MSGLGYGIVRSDLSGSDSATEQVETLRRLARDIELPLSGISILADDTHFALLLATFAPSGITTVVVPTSATLEGWMHAFRLDVDVLTANPLHRWPRRPGATPSAAE
ncbi:hypothetical protein [Nocardia sp. IFM 10818]